MCIQTTAYGRRQRMLVAGWATLLKATLLAVVLLGYSFPEVEASHARAVVEQLKNLQDYMKELEFIEEEEQLQGLSRKDQNTVGRDTIITTCDLIVKDQIEVNDDDAFQDLVMLDLQNWDECLRRWNEKSATAEWNFETDMTDTNNEVLTEVEVEMSTWVRLLARNAQQYLNHAKSSSLSDDVRRRLSLIAFVTEPKEESAAKELVEVKSRLQSDYSKATVNGEQLEPDLTRKMAESRDGNELLKTWKGWRDVTGPNMRTDYSNMVKLLNQGAVDNGFSDYAAAWMTSQFYGTDNMEQIAEQLWQEIKPLYQELHAYMRTRLAEKYPEYHNIYRHGGIPAHLSGNMWAQDWGNIYDILKPYPAIEEPNIDDEMIKQRYTVDSMFDMAEQFYTSIGMYPMSEEFKSNSMKVRPKNKDVVCHAAAFDFYSAKPKQDVRIKMCTEVNMEYLETIHHEMGHIEYFMAYQDQPAVYRTGANSAFHEAVGDTISLSVMSKKHLETVQLLTANKNDDRLPKVLMPYSREINELEDEMGEINFLLKRALFKIGFIPFGYMIDKWRWEVFRGNITEEHYNQRWWELRLEYQGLVSPIPRSETDFDPGAKFHIPSNSPYICYFISFIVQFQFYEAMCEASGHKGPLHTCDFYNSKEAGEKLLDMLKLGMSKPWPEAMEKLTGSREISTSSIMKYFDKLHQWLKDENKRSGAHVGWENARIN